MACSRVNVTFTFNYFTEILRGMDPTKFVSFASHVNYQLEAPGITIIVVQSAAFYSLWPSRSSNFSVALRSE